MSAAWWPLVGGDADSSYPSLFAAARPYGLGRVVIVGHDGVLNQVNVLDNGTFSVNAVQWLDGGGSRRFRYTTGHSEWVTQASLSGLSGAITALGFDVAPLAAPLTPAALAEVSVLLVGNAWSTFTPEEIESVRQWVEAGGGLLLTGLGWSWEPYHPGTTIEDYPMTRMAAPYEARWLRGVIADPTNQLDNSAVFHTFYPDVVTGTLDLAMATVNAAHASHPADLPATLEVGVPLQADFVHAHLDLAIPGRELPLSHPHRQLVLGYLSALAQAQAGFYSRATPISQSLYPTATLVRERLFRTWLDTGDASPAAFSAMADALGITGVRRDVLLLHGVGLLDNLHLTEAQVTFIRSYLTLLPENLSVPRSISVNEFLGTPSIPVPLSGATPGVNIFGVAIGGVSENQFPPDVPPALTDLYSIVVAHELNHVVDAYTIAAHPVLRLRRDQLIAQAGSEPLNYLRSMLGASFFVQNPQEFVASIANQWFASSARTLDLGLARFDAGRTEPLNQAIFFAEVYSGASCTTSMYRIGTEGTITRTLSPVLRDPAGRIDAVIYGGRLIRFTLDTAGNVTGYTSSCRADWNADGSVTSGDISAFLSDWLAAVAGGGCTAESDGVPGVNSGDISYFLVSWLAAVQGGC